MPYGARGASCSPADCRSRRRLARSIRPISRLTGKPASAAGRRRPSSAPCAKASIAKDTNSTRAFPFDHFTKVTDDDDKALFAFLMSRTPIPASPPSNQLPFPLNVRLVLAGWKALFLRAGPYQNDPAHDAAWNRGGYLVEGARPLLRPATARATCSALRRAERTAMPAAPPRAGRPMRSTGIRRRRSVGRSTPWPII